MASSVVNKEMFEATVSKIKTQHKLDKVEMNYTLLTRMLYQSSKSCQSVDIYISFYRFQVDIHI